MGPFTPRQTRACSNQSTLPAPAHLHAAQQQVGGVGVDGAAQHVVHGTHSSHQVGLACWGREAWQQPGMREGRSGQPHYSHGPPTTVATTRKAVASKQQATCAIVTAAQPSAHPQWRPPAHRCAPPGIWWPSGSPGRHPGQWPAGGGCSREAKLNATWRLEAPQQPQPQHPLAGCCASPLLHSSQVQPIPATAELVSTRGN